MTISGTAILKAIEQVCDGTNGTIRTVPATALEAGHDPWAGQVLSTPRYDVQIIDMDTHEATPISALANRRLATLPISVDIRHKLKSNVQESARRTTRALAILNADRVVQALGFPGNLTTASAGTATNIVSGMMLNLTSTLIEENWDDPPNWLHIQITGDAIVVVSQATS